VRAVMNIGVISYYRERGLYYLGEMFCKALESIGNVHILAKPEGNIIKPIVPKDFSRDPRFLAGPDVHKETLSWAKDFSLDIAFSFETYAQLPMNFKVLSAVKNATGVKLIEVPLADCFHKSWVAGRTYDIFDRIVCLTSFCYNIFVSNNYEGARYIRPGFVCRSGGVRKDNTVVYFHPGGWGGSRKRKNSIVVLQAFDRASRQRGDIELLFHSQMREDAFRHFYSKDELRVFDTVRRNSRIAVHFGTLPRAVFLDMYSRADATVSPALREGLGLTIFESMSLGRPCITTNAPPMNEFIVHGMNSWLCKVRNVVVAPESFTPMYYPDESDLERILKALTKKQLVDMESVVHRTISDSFSWSAFEENIKELVEGIA